MEVFFSYATPVAFRRGVVRYRVDLPNMSRTTSKHLGLHGVRDFKPLTPKQFEQMLLDNLAATIKQLSTNYDVVGKSLQANRIIGKILKRLDNILADDADIDVVELNKLRADAYAEYLNLANDKD